MDEEGVALERILDYLLPVGFLKYIDTDEYIGMLRVGSAKAECGSSVLGSSIQGYSSRRADES